MKLNVSNSTLDTLVVGSGTVQCISANIPAKTVAYEGGALRENTSTSYGVYVPSGGKGDWYLANRSSYTNKITGAGTLTIYCTTEKGSDYYATRTPVKCNFTDFEGTIKPTSSQDDPSVLRFTLDIAGNASKATFEIPSGVEVQNSGKTFTIGNVTGNGNLGGSCTFSNNSSVGANTWRVGNDDNFSWGGKVVSNAKFQKIGTGRMTVKGSWTTTGAVAVNEGEMNITSSTCLGTGTLTIAKDAVFYGVTSANNTLTNSQYTVNGTLQVGSSRNSATGVMKLGGKNITFNAGSTYVVGASRCATATSGGCANLQDINRMVMNGTIQVFLSSAQNLAAGDSIRIFEAQSFSGSPQFDLPEIGNGLDWDTSRISEGLLFVIVSTGIDGIVSGTDGKGSNVYNANGQLVRRNATTLNGLPRGIYFVRGRKVVLR